MAAHHHAHDHHPSHAHHHPPASERALALAALLTGAYCLVEVAGGVLSGSLALLADAGHMLTDVAALTLAWLAQRLARRPADWRRTYGFDRFSVLAAFVNGLALVAIAAWIVWEAALRLLDPPAVTGGLMLGVAAAGLGVNALSFWILSRDGDRSLNRRAAVLHVLGDLLGSVAAIAAALVILATGWTPIDPLLSVFTAVVILRSAWAVAAESGHILLEAAPEGLDPRLVAEDLLAHVPGLARVHHVHAWSITPERPMVTLEADLSPGADPAAARRAVRARLAERWSVAHVTAEIAHRDPLVDPAPTCPPS